jgi:hypothetical protein
MHARVLRPFVYGHDGIHGEDMTVGLEREFHDDVCPGLIAAGLIAPLDGAAAEAWQVRYDTPQGQRTERGFTRIQASDRGLALATGANPSPAVHIEPETVGGVSNAERAAPATDAQPPAPVEAEPAADPAAAYVTVAEADAYFGAEPAFETVEPEIAPEPKPKRQYRKKAR